MSKVGKSEIRVDAFDKATGRTKYYEDRMPAGALYARIKHATIAHGYVKSIDTSAAEAIDGVVQFGAVRTGELQGQSLLDGLAELKGGGPYNIELFGGGPADPNAPLFFEGAMKVLQPKIDDGTLVVQSGQTEFTQAATPDWDNAKAQARMEAFADEFSTILSRQLDDE